MLLSLTITKDGVKRSGNKRDLSQTMKLRSRYRAGMRISKVLALLPVSAASPPRDVRIPLIPAQPAGHRVLKGHPQPTAKIVFPLSSDHLITLLQYNVLRAALANREIISRILPHSGTDCSSAVLRVLPRCFPHDAIPTSLIPTHLQRAIPHEDWIDMIPHPGWRDNLILAVGTFDEDQLWADTMGVLFEGFPASDCERRGVIAWYPPWDISGWEMSERFWRRCGWLLKGCEDALMATNKWRAQRGEAPIVMQM